MTWTWLTQVEPNENKDRFYAVGVQPTLLDPFALIRLWGSRSTSAQRMMIEPYPDPETARMAADRLICEKVRGGYRIVAGHVPAAIGAVPGGRRTPG